MHPGFLLLAAALACAACSMPPLPHADASWHICSRTERGCLR